MKSGTALALLAVLSAGCRSAHDVAQDSYTAATAPVNIVREQPAQTTTAVTSTPTAPQPPPTTTSVTQTQPLAPPNPQPRPAPEELQTSSASSPRTNSALEFPTAKPVEGKPGYVYSPFDPGKYVDVSGYAPGSKVKDPYSGKIFLVP